MSSIVPPLDIIPKLPAKGVSLIIKEIDKQTDKLLESVSITVQNSIKLPSSVECNDPRVRQIKKQLQDVQAQITKIQETIPKIQTTINTVKTIVSTAATIKATISAIQLANPITAPLFIAQQLTALQDATIVNAIEALNQFSSVPTTISLKLATIVPPLLASIGKISNVCNGDVDNLEIPQSVIDNISNTSENISNTSEDYNDLIDTEFYTELNVSDDDLENRSDIIEQLLEQQLNLLQSLQEAPSKVYQNQGPPDVSLGKIGDYYIDTNTQTVYGPKLTINSWT
jgi:DNA-binding protein YbaB